MSDEPEFNVINIWLGICIPLLIFNYILQTLNQMFNSLGIIFVIIMCILYFRIGMIIYREMKIWAKVI